MATAGILELKLLADLAELQNNMNGAKSSVGAAMESIERSVALAQKAMASNGDALKRAMENTKSSIDALSKAEKERASLFTRTLDETKRLFGITKTAADETAKSIANLKINPDALKVPSEVYASLTTWQEKMAYGIGVGAATAWDKTKQMAKNAWEDIKSTAERSIAIWGIAAATGVAAGALSAVYAAYKAVSFGVGLLTGESYKSESIDKTIKANDELIAQQKELAAALRDAGTAIDANKSSMSALGVVYEDGSGKALQTVGVLANAKKVLEQYTEGTARNAAATALGLGSYEDISKALKSVSDNSQEARSRLNDFNLGVGTESAAAAQAYKSAMEEFNAESEKTAAGFSRAWSDQIMPVLTDMAVFFKDGFPSAVNAFRAALASVTSVFYGFKTIVYSVSETVLGSLQAIGIGVAGISAAATAAMSGNLTGSKDVLVAAWEDAKARLKAIGANISEQAVHDASAVKLAWAWDNRKDGLPTPDIAKGLAASTAEALKVAESYKTKGSEALTSYQQDIIKISAAMDDLVKNGKAASPEMDKLVEAGRKALELSRFQKPKAADTDKELQSMKSMIRATQDRIAVAKAQSQSNDKQVEGERELAKVMASSTAGYSASALAARKHEIALLNEEIAIEKLNASKAALKHFDETTNVNLQLLRDEASVTELTALEVQKLTAARVIDRAANVAIDKGADGIVALANANAYKTESASLIEKIAAQKMSMQLEQEIAQLQVDNKVYLNASDKAAAALEKKAAEQRKLIAAFKEEGPALEKLKADYSAWYEESKKGIDASRFNETWQSVDKTAHDTFVNIFSGGQDAFTKLRDTLKATLLDLLYQMTVRKWVFDITASITGNSNLVGALAQGASGGAGSGIGSFLGGAASSVGSFGSNTIGAASAMMKGEVGFTELLGEGATAVQAGQIASGLGTIAGAIGPIALGVAAASQLMSAMQGSIQATGTYLYGGNTATGYQWGGRQDYAQSGGMFGGGNTKNSSWFDPQPAVAAYMTAVGEAVTNSVKDMAQSIGLSTDAINGFGKQIEVSIGGLNGPDTKAAIDKAFTAWGEDMVQAAFGSTLLPLAKSGETTSQTFTRLVSDLQTVNGVLTDLKQPLFDMSLGGSAAAEALIKSAGGLDKLQELATALTTVNERLEKLGLPLLDVSVASAQAAEGLLKATENALKAREAADRLQTETDSFSMALLKANGDSTASLLQTIADRTLASVAAAIPSITNWSSLSKITPDQYAGYSEADRAKLQAAVAAHAALRDAMGESTTATVESAGALKDAAKTAKEAADTAARAYADALQAVQDDTRETLAQMSDIGKTDFQKRLAQIQRDGVKQQAELDKLSSAADEAAKASDKAAKAYADADKKYTSLTNSIIKSENSVTSLTTAFDTASAGAQALGGAASQMISGIAAAIAAASSQTATSKSQDQLTADAWAMTVHLASGGAVSGPGTATSDSVPAMLSDGEYVIKASSAAKYGTHFLDALNAGSLHSTVYRATGGYVWHQETGSQPGDSKYGFSREFDWYRRQYPAMAQWDDAKIYNWANRGYGVDPNNIYNYVWNPDTGTQAADAKYGFTSRFDWYRNKYSDLSQWDDAQIYNWANGGNAGSSSWANDGNSGTGSSGGAVDADTLAKINLAYEEQRQNLLELYKALKPMPEVITELSQAAGFDVSTLSADGIKKYLSDLLEASKPMADGSFSDEAKNAINQIDLLGGSIGQLIEAAQKRQEWQDRLDVLSGKTTEEALQRQADLASTTDTATLAIIEQVHAQENANRVAKENQGWQDKLAVLVDPTAQRRIDMDRDLAAATDETTQALIRQYYAQVEQKEAYAQAMELVKAMDTADITLLRAQGREQEAVNLQRSVDIRGMTQAQVVAYDYARAIEKQVAILNERKGLETQLLQAQGDTLALRAKERAALDESNRAIYDQIKALEDEKAVRVAMQTVAQQYKSFADAVSSTKSTLDAASNNITQGYLNAQDAVATAQQAVQDAITQNGQALLGLAKQIRDFVSGIDQSDAGGLNKVQRFAVAQSDYAIALAQAKAGDKDAMGKLTNLAGSLLNLGKDVSVTSVDYRTLVAQTKASLGDFAKATEAQNASAQSSTDPVAAAQDKLAKAQADLALWNQAIAESGASTQKQVTDYAADWRKANQAYLKALGDKSLADQLVEGLDTTLKTPLQDLADAVNNVSQALELLRSTSAGAATTTARTTTTAGTTTTSSGSGAGGSTFTYATATGTPSSWAADTGLAQGTAGSAAALAQSATSPYGTAWGGNAGYFNGHDISGVPVDINVLTGSTGSAQNLGNVDMLYGAAKSLGLDSADIAQAYSDIGYNITQAEILQRAQEQGIPAFAVGTNYVPKNMLAFLHEGEAVQPKAYNPAAGGSAQNTERLERLVEVLTAEVQRLQALQRDNNIHTRRTADAVNGTPEAPLLTKAVK